MITQQLTTFNQNTSLQNSIAEEAKKKKEFMQSAMKMGGAFLAGALITYFITKK